MAIPIERIRVPGTVTYSNGMLHERRLSNTTREHVDSERPLFETATTPHGQSNKYNNLSTGRKLAKQKTKLPMHRQRFELANLNPDSEREMVQGLSSSDYGYAAQMASTMYPGSRKGFSKI